MSCALLDDVPWRPTAARAHLLPCAATLRPLRSARWRTVITSELLDRRGGIDGEGRELCHQLPPSLPDTVRPGWEGDAPTCGQLCRPKQELVHDAVPGMASLVWPTHDHQHPLHAGGPHQVRARLVFRPHQAEIATNESVVHVRHSRARWRVLHCQPIPARQRWGRKCARPYLRLEHFPVWWVQEGEGHQGDAAFLLRRWPPRSSADEEGVGRTNDWARAEAGRPSSRHAREDRACRTDAWQAIISVPPHQAVCRRGQEGPCLSGTGCHQTPLPFPHPILSFIVILPLRHFVRASCEACEGQWSRGDGRAATSPRRRSRSRKPRWGSWKTRSLKPRSRKPWRRSRSLRWSMFD